MGPVQPVDGKFGAGGPLHHGHVVLAGDAQRPDQATMTNMGFLRSAKNPETERSDLKMRKEGCGNVSPHPRVIGFPHLDGVKRPVEVDHIERDDWVLLASLRSQRRKWRETRKRNQSV